MKTILLLIFTIFFVRNVTAQSSKNISTTIVNNIGIPISQVSAVLFTREDSSLVTTTFTNNKGVLSLNVKPNKYFIVLSKDSFATTIINIDTTLIMDSIYFMPLLSNQKEAVIIIANPILYKEDTIQFNNLMFKNDSLKSLEEVLRKFPGVTIDREGNVEINGQPVSEILLDGEPLPTNDIKMLIQTLQAGLIDKIQFIDKKPDEARFSKVDNGVRKKAINIKLKQKSKRSFNQSYYAGIGTLNRYEASTNFSYLHDAWYVTLAASSNNTGRSGFSNINYYNPNGITTGLSANGYLRYTNGTKFIWNSFINIGARETLLEENRNRVIFLKDSLGYYTQDLNTINNNNSSTFNTAVTYRPDTLSEWKASLNVGLTNFNNIRDEQFVNSNNSKIKTNEGLRNNNGIGEGKNVSANISGGRRNKKRTQSYYTNITATIGNTDDYSLLANDIKYYRSTGLGYDTTQQKINNESLNKSINGSFTYYKDIIKNFTLSTTASINLIDKPIERTAFFKDYTTNDYTIKNSNLFNDVRNLTNYISGKIGITRIYKWHNISINLSLNKQINKNIDYLKDTTLLQNAKFWTPNIVHVYNNKKISITNNVTFTQKTPTTEQLQPIVNNANPLVLRKGNPDLKNEQNITISSTARNIKNPKGKVNFLNITFNQTLNFTQNRIANNTVFDPVEGKQVIVPINLPNSYSLNDDITVAYFINKSKLNISGRLQSTFSQSNNFLNSELNKLNIVTLRPKLGVTKDNPKYGYEAHIGYLYQTNTYSVRPQQNIRFGNITSDASANILIAKNLTFKLDYQQTVNNNRRSIQRINNLNGSLSQLFKYKKANINVSLQAFDIFNQNSNVLQHISDFYEENVTSIAIRKFYLLSINVRFNQFKTGKKLAKPKMPKIKKEVNTEF